MAKKLISQPTSDSGQVAEILCSNAGPVSASAPPLPEYDLVGDIIFDPALSAEELRQRFGIGKTFEERVAEARRQLADARRVSGDSDRE
jgi:hypothetical protein